ncbi:MAG: polyprenyl synthetase family protein [Bacteroidales bacterium]|nr:polyprenyl synthetase family protein [Bacteroidales bacterium]
MNREEIISLLGSDWTAFESTVRSKLHSGIDILDKVNDSLLANSGKRLRPMLALLMAGAMGGSNQDSINYAAASELLHNATLFHDDVADKSATRRGKPTLASLMGADKAVLIGDYWLSKAVELVVATAHHNEVTPLYARTLSLLAEGEMLQLQKAGTADTTEQDYLRIIYSKTASLFETTCHAAAIAVNAPSLMADAAALYGAATGMAFQIRDDIFDYGASGDIGKPVGSDIKEGKITLPLLGVLRGSPEEERIRGLVAGIADHPEDSEQIRNFVLAGGGIEYATRRLNDYVNEALDALEAFPPSAHKDALAELARFNAIRTV